MINFFFFTELSKLGDQTGAHTSAQSDVNAYGPVLSYENDKYRVTSKLIAKSVSKAFAVSDGVVIIQPQSDPDYVNLILYPTSLLSSSAPVQFFVYKGLKKENFIDGYGKVIALNTTKSTDLTNKIWNNFNELKQSDTDINASEPHTNTLGWNLCINGSSVPVPDDMSNSLEFYEYQAVSAGDYIGMFEGTSTHPIGFEIYLKDKFYNYTFGDFRADEIIITPSYTIQPGSDVEGKLTTQNMLEREQILNFIDPAAYYNTYYDLGVYEGDSNNIYYKNQVFENVTKWFFTRNLIYLDIRNENGYSLNYYKDYADTTVNGDFNIKTGDSVSSCSSQKYYKKYWPIYTETRNGISSSTSSFHLSIYDGYDTLPFYYYDYTFLMYQDAIFGDTTPKFQFEVLSQQNWTLPYQISDIPVNSDNKTISWIIRIYVGKKQYPISLPSTSPKKVHYLDYQFGPISSISASSPASGFFLRTLLGKKIIYIPHRKTVAVIEVVIGETSDEIHFGLKTLHEAKLTTPNNIYLVNRLPFIGNFDNPDHIYNQEFSEINFLSKSITSSSYSTKLVFALPSDSYDSSFVKPFFMLSIGRSEFNTHIMPAIDSIDPSVHEVSLNIVGIGSSGPTTYSMLDEDTDTNGTTFHTGVLRLKGLATNSIPAIDNTLQSIDILTLDGMFFQSHTIIVPGFVKDATDSNAYIGIDDIISHVKIVESVYFSDPNPDPDYNTNDVDHNIEQEITRLRVYYYGEMKHGGIERYAFDRLVPDAPTHYDEIISTKLPPISFYRKLNKLEEKHNSVFKIITSHADENNFHDNPSPYLQFPDTANPQYSIDFGQILYGFDSLRWDKSIGMAYEAFNDYYLYKDSSFSSQLPFQFNGNANSHYPLRLNQNDYAGVLANIATPIAEYFCHLKKGESPQSGLNTPLIADLDFYYAISAPNADFLGNVDAIGIYKAYEYLKGSSELKLSDVLTLYYKGKNSLRGGLTYNTNIPYYNYQDRWKIFALDLDFLKVDGGTFVWRPDDQTDTEWDNIRIKYLNKMWMFTEFWYNSIVPDDSLINYHYLYLGGSIMTFSLPGMIYRFIYSSSESSYYDNYFNIKDYESGGIIGSKTEYNLLKDSIVYCFDQKFVPYIKTKLIEEGVI